MTPEDTLSTTARATAACAGPNICTACVAFLMVTLLKRSVSGFAGRLGVTTASSLVKPSVLFANVLTKACPAWATPPDPGRRMVLFGGLARAAPPRGRPATPRRRAIPTAAARSRAPPASSPSPGGRSRVRGRAGRPAPPAAAGSGDARRGAAGSCGLNPERPLVRRLELLRRREIGRAHV